MKNEFELEMNIVDQMALNGNKIKEYTIFFMKNLFINFPVYPWGCTHLGCPTSTADMVTDSRKTFFNFIKNHTSNGIQQHFQNNYFVIIIKFV